MVRASSEPGAQRWKPFNRVDRAVERNVSLTTYFDHACKPIRVNVFCALEARNFVSLSDSNLLFSCRIRHCLSPTAYSLTRDAAAVRRHNYVFRLIVFCYESFRVRRHPVVKNWDMAAWYPGWYIAIWTLLNGEFPVLISPTLNVLLVFITLLAHLMLAECQLCHLGDLQ